MDDCKRMRKFSFKATIANDTMGDAIALTATTAIGFVEIDMIQKPTGITISAASDFVLRGGSVSAALTSLTFSRANAKILRLSIAVAAGLTAEHAYSIESANTSAELVVTGGIPN